MLTQPRQGDSNVSVVINTDGRCESLAATLAALRFQTHPNFEICVVTGPTRDGTHELVAELEAAGKVKSANCPRSNLSMSRNLGIGIAAGEYVAFIDDDALPEPVWLAQLLQSFDRPEVAGASGIVLQPNGRDLQFRFSTCDRFGRAKHDLDQPAGNCAFPLSAHFPHVMGTNALFRRDALVAVRGFDEEYEYYLDEADLCCRLIDAGYIIRQRNDAPVHHKFLTGMVRDGEGITVRHYPILKNQLYFGLINGRSHASVAQILDVARAFAEQHRADVAGHVASGRLHSQALVEFHEDYDRALADALLRGLLGSRRLPSPAMFDNPPAFRPATVGRSATTPRRRHFGIVVNEDPIPSVSLVAARSRAERLLNTGNFVRILVQSCNREGVEVVDGVWHHFVSGSGRSIGRSATALREAIEWIASHDPFDAIEDEADALGQSGAPSDHEVSA